ncbi:MAG TPA: DNA translocase FtsK [Bacteroidota bacterium]|nr:DNA translocase FtsK [Bacteroidota bacterium]
MARTRNESGLGRQGLARTPGRRAAVIGILMIAVSLLVVIALVTYDSGDESRIRMHLSDLPGFVSGDPTIRAMADTVHNGLGILGALLAHFLINSTFGYSVYALPLLILMWGWTILRRSNPHRAFIITNYALIFMLLISSSFGMIALVVGSDGPGKEWSGIVGYAVASLLAQLVGKAGGAILLFVGLLLAAVFAADLDIHEIIERAQTIALRLMDYLARLRESRRMRSATAQRPARAGSAPAVVRETVTIAKPPLEEPDVEELPAPIIKRAERPLSGTSGMTVTVSRPTSPQAQEEERGEILPFSGDSTSPAASEEIDYTFPSVELLDPPRPGKEDVDDEELAANADLLRATLAEFDVELESVSVTPGPVVTLYELVPASGVKISRIVSLENDMALKLAAKGIRIMAPIPGKSAVGVEIPNSHRSLVTIRSVINSNVFRETRANLPLALGKTIAGEVFTDDLSKMPHLLMAGSTGSGKSVGINTILASLLYRLHPSELKLVIIDPKKIELAQYGKLKHHFLAISPDVDEPIITTPSNAVVALRGVEFEMERRYDRLAAAGVRNIIDYNERLASGRMKSTETVTHAKMPYLLVVIDELADLMITAAREVEEPIARLAQLARAVGIHLIVATQRPSVDVITGVIKANFPARIAYQVASKTDSRTILDMNGAEQLLGNGDMLYLASGSPKPVRLQNAFVSTDEVDRVVDHIGSQVGYSRPFLLPSLVEKKRGGDGESSGDRDELFEEAARLIVRHQQGSVSLLQRRLKVGYSRAARLVDELEAAGIVGPFDGSKARDVLVETEAELDTILNNS